jgi:hypothetical protein
MKKQVRIRKALPGETPGYYNKTAKFLKKAAMGMEVSSPSMDPARINQIYEDVYISLKNDATPDLIYNQLINEYALDENTSVMLIKSALSKLAEEGYEDPDLIEGNESGQPQEAQDPQQDPQQQSNEDAERAASDAEQEQLAMSDQGYYDDEEALNNDTSHLENEQDEQEQAFRYGGYFADGGEEQGYDYEDQDPNQQLGREEAVMGQFDNPGNPNFTKPYSIEDLIAITPGMQNQGAFPDLASYIGDYRSASDSFEPQDYLPRAQLGGSGIGKAYDALIKYIPKINTPMTNFSKIRKAVPGFSAIGHAMTKIPYVGPKFAPKLATSFTQNRNELWNVLNGATPKTGIFSQNGTYAGGTDGSLQADRLLLYQDDVKNIILKLTEGNNNFSLGDIEPLAEQDGLVSGIYPLDSKIVGGTDDEGNNFFELKHTFGPNQPLPFGTTPAKAKEVTFKNRFYYNQDPATGELKVFDPLGNPLTTGAKTKYDINRPLGTTASRFGKYLTTDQGLLETNKLKNIRTGYEGSYPPKNFDGEFYDDYLDSPNGNLPIDINPIYGRTGKYGTPFPNYMNGMWNTNGVLGKSVGRLNEISDVAPNTFDKLGWKGKIGRTLETLGTTGLNQLFRTSAKNVDEISLPTYGYANSALGPNILNPANEGSYGSDIRNAINYKYRLGLKTSLIGGGLGYLGYKTYDAYANPCQCTDPLALNYMAPDIMGNCPCGTDVGPSKILDPDKIEKPTIDPALLQETPDTLYQGNYSDPDDEFKKGGAAQNRFIKKMVSMYADGGPSNEGIPGQGKRDDTLTNDISNTKNSFFDTLKNNSNTAISKEIYKNAQGNPQILNLLTQDGYKPNLAEDAFKTSPSNTDPTAAFGGFIDMDAEEPLTKFIYGGDDEDYYQQYGLEEAQTGITVNTKSGNRRGMQDKMTKEDWKEGEREDWEAANPNRNFDTDYDNEEQGYIDYQNFYDQALQDTYNDVGSSNVVTQTNCGPGTTWSATYNRCIQNSKINYIPKEVRPQSGWRDLMPWNPLVQSQGSWVKQKGTPYYLNDGRSYNGLVSGNPVASYTTKKGLLGGRKKWIDIYDVNGAGAGNGVPMQDLGKLQEMLSHRKGQRTMNRGEYLQTKKSEDGKERRGINRKGQLVKQEINSRDYVGGEEKDWTEEKEYGGPINYTDYAYGGDIAIPELYRAQIGLETPPAGAKKVDFDPSANSMSLNNMQNFFGAEDVEEASLPESMQSYNYTNSPIQPNSKPVTDVSGNQESQYVGIKRKRKNVIGVDPEASLAAGNAISNGILGAWNRMKQAPMEYNNTLNSVDPMQNQGMASNTNKGWWQDFGSKTGLYDYNNTGSNENSISSSGNSANTNRGRYGGYMQDGGYANPFYEEDDEVEMTPYELQQYLAAGGQVEYL